MKGLQGKKALVTGGSSGIGQAIAIRLGEEGVDVAINYVGPPEGAEETRDAIEHGVEICMKEMSAAGTHPILVAADVSQEDRVGAMFDQALTEYRRIDVLVNNAGIQIAADTDELAVAAFGGRSLRPGDALLFHTGWGGLWGADDERYSSGEPGPGLALAGWPAEHRVALTGCDTWSYGPVPAEDPAEPFVVPQTLTVRHGVVVLENLRPAEAAAAGLREFLLVVSHAKLRGATGA